MGAEKEVALCRNNRKNTEIYEVGLWRKWLPLILGLAVPIVTASYAARSQVVVAT